MGTSRAIQTICVLGRSLETFGLSAAKKVTFACERPLLPRLFVPASAIRTCLGQLSETLASRCLRDLGYLDVPSFDSYPV